MRMAISLFLTESRSGQALKNKGRHGRFQIYGPGFIVARPVSHNDRMRRSVLLCQFKCPKNGLLPSLQSGNTRMNPNEPHPRAENRGCCFGAGSKVSKPDQQPQGPLDPLDREFSYCLHSCMRLSVQLQLHHMRRGNPLLRIAGSVSYRQIARIRT
jgi:hypothetical protein